MALSTNRPFLHIIIIIIHIFLFCTATANLCACFPLKPIGFYITGQVSDILKVPFSNPFASYSGGFIISANIDNREAIQVCTKQPLIEGLSHYKLSRDSYYICRYPYSLLKGYISKSLFLKAEPRNQKEKCCPWDSNQGPLVQHACITAQDTCL